MALLPVEDALARILGGLAAPEIEHVDIFEADGRVLAADLTARLTQPPFDASAMDGYAVQGPDAAAGRRLAIIGVSQAGQGFAGRVAPGQAVRIYTGAPMPEGADTVVIQEDVERDGDAAIATREATRAGANVRAAGIDFKAGDTGLKAGRHLDAHSLTLAAAMGYGTVPVTRRPVVAILATGDELVAPGVTPGPDQIVSSNPVGLAALVRAAGGVPHLLGIAPDDAEAIGSKIAAARTLDGRGADLLVTIGGASVGDRDLIGPVLAKAGLELSFWKVAIRPGKPLLFGRLGPMRVLGLPGNPVSALICGRVFMSPLVSAMAGAETRHPNRRKAMLTAALDANGPRLHLMRAKLTREADGRLSVAPLGSQDSSLLSTLSLADALIVRAPGAGEARAGDVVEVEAL